MHVRRAFLSGAVTLAGQAILGACTIINNRLDPLQDAGASGSGGGGPR